MRFDDLQGWLSWQETLHPNPIDLGLERVANVWSRLRSDPVPFPVITIAGTNGKGSCVALLESIYLAAGYRTGCYTSPHLLSYNERIRLNGRQIRDRALCEAFERVDDARGDTSLTYFEFGTLAALDLFVRDRPDVAILEVGLGGRLDAVNILDPDVAVVTTIGLDHTAWLGETVDEIAVEKGGIFRRGRPAVIGHRSPSPMLIERAERLGCGLFVLGREFDWREEGAGWCWAGLGLAYQGLPKPALRGRFQYDNAATALTALSWLAPRLPVCVDHIRVGLTQVRLQGRFQVVAEDITWILDVAHNAQAAAALASTMRLYPCQGRIHAVLAVLGDKDPKAIASALAGEIDSWYLAHADHPRALSASDLQLRLKGITADRDLKTHTTIEAALKAASSDARPGDCVLVFGSFLTVEAALRWKGSPVPVST